MINFDQKIVAVVIDSIDYKEYDKLFKLFSKEYGKINAYAFGVRRVHSKKIGALRLFAFCNVFLKSNNEKYGIVDVEILKDFGGISKNYELFCYASYFVELIDYFGYENIESSDVFYLLYYSFKALIDRKVDTKLIKLIFELKLLKYQGEYRESSMLGNVNNTLIYTWDFVLKTLPQKLFTFNLKDDVFKSFEKEVEYDFKSKVNFRFKSLERLNEIP